MILPYKGKKPKIHKSCFIADSADIIGDVTIGENSSVWFRCVVRGDVNFIRVGNFSNIQDGAILHVTRDLYPLTIGDFVTIAHGAMVHGAVIQSRVLIGIGAIIMDNAEVGELSIVAAGALVTEGNNIPPRSLAMGVPAKVVRELSEEEIAGIENYAANYQGYRETYLKMGAEGKKK
jgi:carbonic anhydrase/acetyltransferase-like protein (isoleucine patch superfamily)